MNANRGSAAFIPYYGRDGVFYFFLQKRTVDAPINPALYGLFGGGMEGEEKPEETLVREVREELNIEADATYFKSFDGPYGTCHVFSQEVSPDFETSVTVFEGDYGRFMSEQEILTLPDIIPFTLDILVKLAEHLRSE